MEKSSGQSSLPSFADRLPDLTSAIRTAAKNLASLSPPASYLPEWESLYQTTHNMKGVLNILKTPEKMRAFLLSFHDALLTAAIGQKTVRATAPVGAALAEIANHLDANSMDADLGLLEKKIREMESLYTDDIPHSLRIKPIPTGLYYVSESVSKRVREMQVLDWNHCIVEDEILLEQIPFWRAQLQESLLLPSGAQGLLINFLPFISSEGSKTLNIWAWVTAPTESRAALKQKIKDEMPKVKITSLKLLGEKN